jgi:RNA polymerase sigma factor (sigma-70 family)
MATVAPEYEKYIRQVDAVVNAVSRRHGLTEAQAEDIRSETWLKLLRTGGRVFERFSGEHRLRTYLAAIVRNVIRDQRNKEWGKWRPSSAARRFGAAGIAVDKLLNRDCMPVDVIQHYVGGSVAESAGLSVQQIASALPIRCRRQFVSEDALATMPSPDPSPFERASARERRRRQMHVKRALRRALATLSRHDRALIASRYLQGKNLACHARAKGEDQKRLYRRFSRILRLLRTHLEFEGINSGDVQPCQ